MLAQGIQMGRDALFNLLRETGWLLRRRRRKTITTWSKHPFRKYRNLIKAFAPTTPNQLWVSDITYLKTQQGFVYLSLITDAYSRKIVGYDLSDNLESVNALQALLMALASTTEPRKDLIHHSDRGIQYCSHDYVGLLQQHHIQISMTENGDPLENAIAERINGILKHEYLLQQPIQNKQHAMQLLEQAVTMYNKHRPHLSCNMLTPDIIHQQQEQPKRLWKNYYRKRTTIVNPLQD
jgi:transposase InsO family protein